MAVFERFVDGSRDCDALIDQVDASRVTIARILRELEAREWIMRSGHEYTVTPLGEWVYEEFARLIDEMEAAQRLREPYQWMPDDLIPFDIRRLRDAELILLDGSIRLPSSDGSSNFIALASGPGASHTGASPRLIENQ